MTISKEQISRIERDANALIENLNSLYEKVGTYDTARQSLEQTNHNLRQFISETKSLAEQSQTIVQNVKEIGALKISEQLSSLTSALQNFTSQQTKTKKMLLWGISIIILFQITIMLIIIF